MPHENPTPAGDSPRCPTSRPAIPQTGRAAEGLQVTPHTHPPLRAGTRRHPTATPAAEEHLHLAGRSRARPLPLAGTRPAATGPGPARCSGRETSPTRREKPRLASPRREAAVPGTYVVGAAVGAVVADGTERVARDGSRHDGRPPPPPPSPTSHRERPRPRPLPAEAPAWGLLGNVVPSHTGTRPPFRAAEVCGGGEGRDPALWGRERVGPFGLGPAASWQAGLGALHPSLAPAVPLGLRRDVYPRAGKR